MQYNTVSSYPTNIDELIYFDDIRVGLKTEKDIYDGYIANEQ